MTAEGCVNYLHANNNKSANTQLSSYLAHAYGKKNKKNKKANLLFQKAETESLKNYQLAAWTCLQLLKNPLLLFLLENRWYRRPPLFEVCREAAFKV